MDVMGAGLAAVEGSASNSILFDPAIGQAGLRGRSRLAA